MAENLTSDRRRRMFVGAVRIYNVNHGDEVGVREAWDVFKGLLGQSDQQDMIRVIEMVYGDPDVMEQVRAMHFETDNDRITYLRNVARRFMRRYRAEHMLNRVRPYHMHPEQQPPPPQQAPPPPPQAAVPVMPAPAPPAVVVPAGGGIPRIPLHPPPVLHMPAPVAHVNPANRIITTYELFKGIIERTGKIDPKDIAIAGDELTPVQIENLFTLMREWGECPICLEYVPHRYKWTFSCDDMCCPLCMNEFICKSMEVANFPVNCPGRCGNVIDPRKVLDVAVVSRMGTIAVPENIVRFVSLQLASIHTVDPLTVRETHVCPFCRAIVTGRPDSASPIGRCTNPFCAQRFCTNCKTPWHDGIQCNEKMKIDKECDTIIASTSKPCPRCGRRASHFRYHACHHLKCPCGHEYCYECMDSWSEHAVGKSRESCRIFCHDGCHCSLCDECKPGKPCKVCGVGGCPKCKI